MGKLLKCVIGVAAIGCLMSGVNAYAGGKIKFKAELSDAQSVSVPPLVPGLIESAKINADFEKDLSAVKVKLTIEGGSNVAAAHFHCARAGANGPVAVTILSAVGPLFFDGIEASGTLTNADVHANTCMSVIGRPVNNIASLALAMRDGLIYVNVHTSDNPGGEFRGQMLE